MPNRYQDIAKTKIDGKIVYKTSHYPEVPLSENDIYIYSSKGDRFDILALQYYKDSSLWWIISIANETLKQNSLLIPPGIQIRIPSTFPEVIREFKIINQ